MTHPDLVLRAEQAVIGAALRDRRHLDDIAYLAPDRMAHPTHRALLTALIESRISEPTASASRLPELIAQRTAIRGVDAAYLRRLADSSAPLRNIAAYARMVQEASARRELALYLDRLQTSARGLREADPVLDRIIEVTSRKAPTIPPTRLNEPAPAPYGPQADSADQPEGKDRTHAEKQDTVLAGLLQHPEQVAEVSGWLYWGVFDDGLRRKVYEAIVAVEERGESVDQLTVEWEIWRQAHQSYGPETEATVAERPGYLAHLAATAVVVGAAVETAGELMAQDIRSSLATDFSKNDITTRTGVEPRTGPAVRPTPPTPRSEPAPLQQPPSAQQHPSNQPNIRP